MAKTPKTAMDRVMDRVEAWFQGAKPGEYDAGCKQVVCPHCGGTAFAEGVVNVHPVDIFAEGGAFSLACAGCGYIQLFLKRPKRRRN